MESSLAACLFAALAARSSELLEVVLSLVESFLAEVFPTFFARAVAFFDASFFFRGDVLVSFFAMGFLASAFLGSVFFVDDFIVERPDTLGYVLLGAATFLSKTFFLRGVLLGFPTILAAAFLSKFF